MAQEQQASFTQFLKELTHVDIYKRNQGKLVRQITFATIAIFALYAGYSLSNFWAEESYLLRYVIPAVLGLGGTWIAFRAVCWPPFADFLISVEAEMVKVSWPDRGLLFRSSIVVIVVMFSLAIILYVYDLVWQQFLQMIGVF